MRIRTKNPQAKPSKSLGREKRRAAPQIARLSKRGEGYVLEATNNHQAVRVPLDVDGCDPPEIELLPPAAVKVLDGPRGELELDATIEASGADGERRLFEVPDHGFPNLDDLWPPEPSRSFRFGVDVNVMRVLAESLGAERLELVFDLDRADDEGGYVHAIRVRAIGSIGGDGVLMPYRLT